MSHARQSRRIATTFARLLGAACGVGEVDYYATGGGTHEHTPTAEDLRATVARGTLGYSEAAAAAGAAQIDGCPKGYERVYYDALNVAAEQRVRELADALEVAA